MKHYECALRNLEDADERAALEALDLAEVFLERAQDDDVRRGLVAEVSLARGALLEVADPSNARLAYDRSFSADGNAAAALRAARLAWRCGDDEACTSLACIHRMHACTVTCICCSVGLPCNACVRA